MFVTRSCHVNARSVSQLPPRIIRLSTYFPPFRSGWNSWRLYKRAAITRKFADSSHCSNLSVSYKRDDSVGQRVDEVLRRTRLAIENGYVSSLIARQTADTSFVATWLNLILDESRPFKHRIAERNSSKRTRRIRLSFDVSLLSLHRGKETFEIYIAISEMSL